MPKQQFPTRPWRAIHDSWLSSERLGAASDQAIILWHMLNTRQDDAGRFHWSPVRVLTLVAVRSWTFDEASKHLADLVRVGSVSVDGDWVTLHRGAELNGTPTSGSKESRIPRFYPKSTVGLPQVYLRSTVSPTKEIETSRDNASRDNASTTAASPPKNKKQPYLTDSETSELHAEYDAALTTERVTAEIASALDHEAAAKRGKSGSWKLYVQTWLRRAAVPPPALFRPTPPSVNGSAPPIDYTADQRRIADQQAHRKANSGPGAALSATETTKDKSIARIGSLRGAT